MNDDQHSLRVQAEKQAGPLPEDIDRLSPEYVKNMVHELRVHQIELEMQNDELRRTQDELAASKLRYFDLYNFAPVGYVTLDGQNIVVEANLTAAEILGISRSELVNQPLTRYILNEDQDAFYMHRMQNTAAGEICGCEVRMIKHDKTDFWARLDTSVVADATGAPHLRVIISDISDFKSSEKHVKTLLEEKEILLKEVHHRIKNNMSTISGLLMLQAASASDPAAVCALTDAQCRIRSMMIMYDKLYRSEDYRKMPVKEYLEKFIDEIIMIFANGQHVTIEKDISDFIVDTKILFPMGIIINELITNSFKYAFTSGREGFIKVSVCNDNSRIHVTIRDNGSGFPDKIDPAKSGGFGLNLVASLTEQFGGELSIRKEEGTVVEVVFNSEI